MSDNTESSYISEVFERNTLGTILRGPVNSIQSLGFMLDACTAKLADLPAQSHRFATQKIRILFVYLRTSWPRPLQTMIYFSLLFASIDQNQQRIHTVYHLLHN